ncbi:MAG: rhodanese-like domain-containing protein, partial [Anaerolineales bacterium]
NLYHIRGAKNVPLEQIPAYIRSLLAYPATNTVYVVISNDESLATEAWKMLVAGGVPNVYILEGGLNNWLATFGEDDPQIRPLTSNIASNEELRYIFPYALGDRYQSADPDPIKYEELEFEPRIKLQMKRDKSGGGCG